MRLSPWQYPDSKEREMQRMLIREYRLLRQELIALLQRRELFRIDVEEDDFTDDLERSIEAFIAWWLLRLAEIRRKLESLYVGMSQFNDTQFRRAIRQLTGVVLPPSQGFGFGFDHTNTLVTPYSTAAKILGPEADIVRAEEFVRELRKRFVLSSSTAVDNAARAFILTTERELARQVQAKTPVNEIVASITKRAERLEQTAANIAREEVAQANAEIAERRMISVGINRYRWRTMRDERVRPSHRDNEGKVFSFANPPSTGNPGHERGCRCHAEPVR
jgi:SPP1 gp7 family putative phage head morphogenesis protein